MLAAYKSSISRCKSQVIQCNLLTIRHILYMCQYGRQPMGDSNVEGLSGLQKHWYFILATARQLSNPVQFSIPALNSRSHLHILLLINSDSFMMRLILLMIFPVSSPQSRHEREVKEEDEARICQIGHPCRSGVIYVIIWLILQLLDPLTIHLLPVSQTDWLNVNCTDRQLKFYSPQFSRTDRGEN